MSWFEGTIIVFIMLGIAAAIWRGGANNPVGTGSLGRDLSKLANRMSAVEARQVHLEKSIEKFGADAASTKDIERLEELGERTFRMVDRIERVLIEKGLGK